ncbi:MAG: phospho-N-acetylmuramoyl-pentapeptide-transferase [Clostridia bacterium]|nr:phospho-N-acetylmuramoyl-pentapeptide-transferase [Clostridia bacterium]
MKIYLTEIILSFFLTVLMGVFFIPILKKLKAGQPILKYVEAHKSKSGTPTMGGLLFIIPSVIVCLVFNGVGDKLSIVSVTLGISFMFVGFLDDFIKIKYRQNEGLKPYQKIIFQLVIAFFAGFFSYRNGITTFYVPFTKTTVDLGFFAIPFISLIFISITNCVNLTDGLDGLASFTAIPYFIALAIIISLQTSVYGTGGYDGLISLCLCLSGGLIGFLVFNVNKAKIFMGDTGSLSIGGFIGALSIFSSNGFFIPVIGIMFVLSGISVIVQVMWFKKTGKRVFLMAPLHHHFQLKGMTETQISYIYAVITGFVGLICVIFLL